MNQPALTPLTPALLRRLARPADSRYQRFVELRTLTARGAPSKQAMYGLLRASSGNWRDSDEDYAYDSGADENRNTSLNHLDSDDDMGKGGANDFDMPNGKADVRAVFEFVGKRRTYRLMRTKDAVTLGGKPVVFRDLSNQRAVWQSPTKAYVTRWAGQWANWGKAHTLVQSARRGTPLPKYFPAAGKNDAKAAKHANWALSRYLRQFAPRAPEKPLHAKTRNGREVRHLFRGIQASPELLAKLDAGQPVPDRGFMAFSTEADVALDHAHDRARAFPGTSVLLRLAVDRVPRGTPWAWFRRKRDASFFRTVPIKSRPFGEVVLPPGTLTAVSHASANGTKRYDVTYMRGANNNNNKKKNTARNNAAMAARPTKRARAEATYDATFEAKKRAFRNAIKELQRQRKYDDGRVPATARR